MCVYLCAYTHIGSINIYSTVFTAPLAPGSVPGAQRGTEKHSGGSSELASPETGRCKLSDHRRAPLHGKMPGMLPGGGGIQVKFCGMAQPCEGARGDAGSTRTPQVPHSWDLSDVQPGRSKATGTALLRGQACPRASLAGRSLG